MTAEPAPVPGEAVYEWEGHLAPWPHRRGTITCTPAQLSAFVEERFGAGWADLSVSDGVIEVAAIGPPPEGGKRSWWCAAAEAPARHDPDWACTPGSHLAELLEIRKMTAAQLAARIGRDLAVVRGILAGYREITPAIAGELEAALGAPSAAFWVNVEANYQADLARLHRSRPWESDLD